MPTVRLSVQPTLIDWACERSGLAQDALERKFADLPKWRSGEKDPTERQLRDFAAATFTPFGHFFGDSPPPDELPIGDFRVRGGSAPARPSPHLLDTIYLCQRQQAWYTDHLTAMGEPNLEWVGSEQVGNDPSAAAHRFATLANLGVETRADARSWEEALRDVRERAEAAGVLVMVNGVVGNNTHRKLNHDEFSGFALSDPVAPLVFVNNADYKASQMFTFAHEFGHLLLGESGVSDDSVGVEGTPDNEAWCDRFAAELLVPADDLRRELGSTAETHEGDLQRLARHYKVSSLVILRRLRTADLISAADYGRLFEHERARFEAWRSAQREQSSSGGNFYNTFFQRTGRSFAYAVVASTLEGQTGYKEMSDLLGISSLETFDKIAVELGVARP